MNSTKETWDDMLKQCRTWIQELTVAKFQYHTFNNSALQRRSQGRILPQKGFFYREKTCPVKHCTFLEMCIRPDCILREKKIYANLMIRKDRFWLRPNIVLGLLCLIFLHTAAIFTLSSSKSFNTPPSFKQCWEHLNAHIFIHLHNEPFGLK